ncbi:MAG: thioesterase family protein [Rhodospirillaceae bacterium]|jgi:acyl-CoA thioesterase FadM|nr:thioesterase family protein [Rhodospirillaceae bacterium]MBT7956121.1 thioesterase family protein [Rhodospirillaceae bacterium]
MNASNFREVNRRVVTQDMCDALGHFNIQYYFETLSDGVIRIMEILGEPIEKIPERGTAFALHKEESQFLAEIYNGDEFYMATALEGFGNTSMILQHRFFSAADDREHFRSRFITVNMDLKARTSIPFSEEYRALAAKEFPVYQPED